MNRTVHRFSLRVLSLGIVSLFLLQTIAGQTGAVIIQVLETNEGQNLLAQETSPIKVRVLDRSGRAIPGANVVFSAPEAGATGRFLPNQNEISVATDSQGMATSPRFRTNTAVGDYEIQVIASYRDSASRVVIPQSNVVKRKASSRKFILFSAIIGGVAAAAFAAKGGNSGGASTALGALPTPTITVGGESVVDISVPIFPVAPPPVTPSVPTIFTDTSSTTSTASTGIPAVGPPIPPSPPPVAAPTPVVQPVPQQPISPECARMPPNSNKSGCR